MRLICQHRVIRAWRQTLTKKFWRTTLSRTTTIKLYCNGKIWRSRWRYRPKTGARSWPWSPARVRDQTDRQKCRTPTQRYVFSTFVKESFVRRFSREVSQSTNSANVINHNCVVVGLSFKWNLSLFINKNWSSLTLFISGGKLHCHFVSFSNG